MPDAGDLSDIERRSQRVLRDMVERAGGRFAGGYIQEDHLGVLSVLFDTWGRRHAVETDRGLKFSGRPGLWHALDELYPLQDPNRWNNLRAAVIARLEDGKWERCTPPRGISFYISDWGSLASDDRCRVRADAHAEPAPRTNGATGGRTALMIPLPVQTR